MGNLLNRSRTAENQENSANPYYYYPPKHGRYFGSNFIMGGDKFEMSQPESYLFGENLDLNYLGGKPCPFPYTAPLPNEPMQMLRALINIRKESLKLVHTSPTDSEESKYSIEFIFDSEVNCAITIYFLCKEESTSSGLKYIPRDITFCSETYRYKAGIGQLFSQSSPMYNPSNYNASELIYQIVDEKGEFNASAPYPVVIYCLAEEGDEPKQSHSLVATIEKVYDQVYSLKPIKQKIFVDGLAYLLQEIYGIENKGNKSEKSTCEDENDNSFECVICMSELRDTLILPCRHLCLCNGCANSLRYQASNCPICRVPFRALLQIKAVKRSLANATSQVTFTESLNDVLIDIPPGYETVPLVQALNGIHLRCTNHSYYEPDKVVLNGGLKPIRIDSDEMPPLESIHDNTANSSITDEESATSSKATGDDTASSSSSSANIQENVHLLSETKIKNRKTDSDQEVRIKASHTSDGISTNSHSEN